MNFLDTIRNLRTGDALTEFEQEFARAVDHAVRTGKSGKLTINLDVRISELGEVPQIAVYDSSKLTLTKPDKPSTLFFKGKDGNLSRRDPRQADFFEGTKTGPTA